MSADFPFVRPKFIQYAVRKIVKDAVDEVGQKRTDSSGQNERRSQGFSIYTPDCSDTESDSNEELQISEKLRHEEANEITSFLKNKTYSNRTHKSNQNLSTNELCSNVVEPSEEELYEQSLYLPAICFYCDDRLFGDQQIARHIFLQECTKKFDYTDIQFFQWIICRLSPTIFPGNVAETIQSMHKTLDRF